MTHWSYSTTDIRNNYHSLEFYSEVGTKMRKLWDVVRFSFLFQSFFRFRWYIFSISMQYYSIRGKKKSFIWIEFSKSIYFSYVKGHMQTLTAPMKIAWLSTTPNTWLTDHTLQLAYKIITTLRYSIMRNAWLYTSIPLLSHPCLRGPVMLLKN
jgi:hypothetical protein